jgi:glycine cleavage system H protein
MSDAPSEKRCRIVPECDLKCVWMTAGILSYQLCERRFDCERCPLDQAMRMHFARGEARDAPATPVWRSERLAADRCYSRGHCWVKRGRAAGGGTSLHRVGLEPGLAAALRVPRAVVAPSAGEEVHRGRAHLWFVTEGGTFALGAPLDGTVHAVNPQLTQRPATVTTDPMEDGWMYELRVPDDSTQLATLLDAGTAERGYGADTRRFQAGLARALRDQSAGAGATLADGGVPLDDVASMLGPARYFALLCKVYG